MEHEESYSGSGTKDTNVSFPGRMPEDINDYRKFHHSSIKNRDEFWTQQADRIKWDNRFTSVVDENFPSARISWFTEGKLNACRNALDTNIEKGKGKDSAFVFFNNNAKAEIYTYENVFEKVTVLAGAIDAAGFKKGDKAAMYLPDSPYSIIFMLACARLGIVYVPIPEKFTAEIASEIIRDCDAGLALIDLSSSKESYIARVYSIIENLNGIKFISPGKSDNDKVVSYDAFLTGSVQKPYKSYVPVDSEHPIFILYANSAAGIPRGSVFSTGGYIVETVSSFGYIFNSEKTGNIFSAVNLASSAAQSYGFWGPILTGTNFIISACDNEKLCPRLEIILKDFKKLALLTNPGLLSDLKTIYENNDITKENKFSLIVSCGDVISPRLVTFAGKLTGDVNNVLNMWIQSESGTALINTFACRELNRPGALGVPFPGIQALALNYMGDICRVNESGQLVFASSWPSMIRTIWGQHDRFHELYFRRFPGYFSTNDGVRVDNDGFVWFMGRIDDVIKVRGQSLATSEIESVLVSHKDVKESAVVSIGGEEGDNLIAFISIDSHDSTFIKSLEIELTEYIIRRIGEFAIPNTFVFTNELPRTRTGKIVRRVLRRIASGDIGHEEDLSHIANPDAVNELLRKKGI